MIGLSLTVHSSACSAQLFQNHRIQFWDHFLKSWCAKVAKAVLGVHTLQLSHRSGRKSRFPRQPVMGHLMVMMSLKLCNSNCFVSRCTQKIDPLFEDFEEMQSIFSMGHMKSRLDGMPSTFSDSSFGTVCLFLFVDCSSWPNLTAACAAQVAQQVVLSSFRHGNTLWRARCRFRNRGLVTILVHLYLCDLL